MKNLQNRIIGILLITILCAGFFVDTQNRHSIFNKLNERAIQQIDKSFLKEISDSHQGNFKGKTEMADIYGLIDRALNKSLVGNFEFIRDLDGHSHIWSETGYLDQRNDQKMLQQMNQLKNICNQKEIPLLYVQIPDRVFEDSSEFAGGFQNSARRDFLENLSDRIEASGIDVFRFAAKGRASLQSEEVFFKTDVHMTTKAELTLLNDLVDLLENDYRIQFPNKDTVLNPANYNILTSDFLGNTAKTVGQYYVGLDRFEMLLPQFPTDLTVTVNSQQSASGDFENTLMNGYHKNGNRDHNTYWITNYGHFTKSNWEIVNNQLENGPRILVIMDSNGYRTTSYMSLMTSSLTVIDPRYGGAYPLTSAFLDPDTTYDAVIVMQSDSLLGYDIIYDWNLDLNAEISNVQLVSVNPENGYGNVEVTVKNTGADEWTADNCIRVGVTLNGADCGIRGNLPPEVVVAPGESYTFTVNNVPPETDMVAVRFLMLQEGRMYFGEPKALS